MDEEIVLYATDFFFKNNLYIFCTYSISSVNELVCDNSLMVFIFVHVYNVVQAKQAHDLKTTSMRRKDVASTSVQLYVPAVW